MTEPVRLVTFDCYGTLVDWRTGIADAFRRHVDGADALDPEALLAAYVEAEAQVEAGPFVRYRTVLARAAEAVCRRFGRPVPKGGGAFLPKSLAGWPPFPDTVPALTHLKAAGPALGVLSNVDDDLLYASLRYVPVPFDAVITAPQVRSYKPQPAHFHAALALVDGHPERMVHVAQSLFHDVVPATSLGIPTVWVNRRGEALPDGVHPAAEVDDLLGAVDWILAREAVVAAGGAVRPGDVS